MEQQKSSRTISTIIAIGKNGQNARLAARLTGTRVDIKVLEKEEDDE